VRGGQADSGRVEVSARVADDRLGREVAVIPIELLEGGKDHVIEVTMG